MGDVDQLLIGRTRDVEIGPPQVSTWPVSEPASVVPASLVAPVSLAAVSSPRRALVSSPQARVTQHEVAATRRTNIPAMIAQIDGPRSSDLIRGSAEPQADWKPGLA